jgi:hypothetical protein
MPMDAIGLYGVRLDTRTAAQVSKPAVSPISKSAERETLWPRGF